MKLKECFYLFFSWLLFQLPIADCRLSIGKDVSHKSLITNRQSTIQPAKAAKVTSTVTPHSGLASQTRPSVSEAYGKLPLSFEANQGADNQVKFFSRGDDRTLSLTATEAILEWVIPDRRMLTQKSRKPNRKQLSQGRHADFKGESSALRLTLVGGNPDAPAVGLDELPGKVNYFIGSDPKKWQTGIPTYAKVKYQDVYSGIDLLYYGNQRQLEYDFVVAPGADPRAIRLSFRGAEKLEIDSQGELVFYTAGGVIRQRKPFAYQDVDGTRKEIVGRYVLESTYEVCFQVEPYNRSRPLTIDPVLYSTYLGGNEDDQANAVAVDAAGNAYVTGQTSSKNFPTANAEQRDCALGSLGGCQDAFVLKINSAGSALVYSTYFGRSGNDSGQGIAVDAAGNAYVTGSLDGGSASAVLLLKLDPTGRLIYTRSFGGGNLDQGNAIALDSADNIYITGETDSDDFLTVKPLQPVIAGGDCTALGGGSFPVDAFVMRLDPTGALVYSTYLGGSGNDRGLGIAVDAAGNAYVAGETNSTNFPLKKPLRSSYQGAGPGPPGVCRADDGFVAVLNPTGSALVLSTYSTHSLSIAVDLSDNVYIGGSFLLNIHSNESMPPAASGLIGVDASGKAYALCDIGSLLNSGQSFPFYKGMAVDLSGNVYVTGSAGSTDLRTLNALQPTNHGIGDGFVAKISECATALPADAILFVPIVLSSSGLKGSFYTSELALTNRGPSNADLHLTYAAAFGGGNGIALDTLAAGEQRLIPDAISYLRSIGIPIPDSGDRGGTLSIRFSGLASPSDAAATVRTTTRTGEGHAGLAYAGISLATALEEPVYLCGLRQTATDRSNVAIQNVGSSADASIVLRLTVFSGDPASPFSWALPDEVLSPGAFKQIPQILNSNGLSITSGYIRVERVSGEAPYYAYGVINDQANSDGSFVTPVVETSLTGRTGQSLPAVVETSSFSTELVLTNWSSIPKTIHFAYVSDAIQTPGNTASFDVALKAGEQSILPDLVEVLRQRGIAGIGPAGAEYAGALFASVDSGDMTGIFMGARTSAPGGGGRYGLFYAGVPYGAGASTDAWLYGLQQDGENRTNLALVNTGETNSNPDTFKIEIFDGGTGLKVNTVEGITLNARHWLQIGTVLAQFAPGTKQGYTRVTRTGGTNTFITYAVINDGGQPGERTGDGAFVSSSP